MFQASRRDYRSYALMLAAVLLASTATAADDDYLGKGKKKDDFARPGGYLSLGAGGAADTNAPEVGGEDAGD